MKLTNKNLISETEYLRIYKLNSGSTSYKIAVTKKRIGKSGLIYCSPDKIALEKIAWRLAQFGSTEYSVLCAPSSLIEDSTCCIFVISGNPKMIKGLDNQNIASVHKFSKTDISNKLYVMTKKEFAALDL